jgi:hypothetical protein
VTRLISSAEIAALKRAPKTTRGVNYLTKRVGWAATTRRGPRGINLYDLDHPAVESLPDELRVGLLDLRAPALALPAKEPVPAVASENRRNTVDSVPLKAIERANARKEIVELSNSLSETDPEFTRLCNEGAFDLSDEARELLPVSKRGLQDWRAKLKNAGLPGLVDDYGYGRRARKIDRFPEVRDWLEANYKEYRRWSNRQLFCKIAVKFPDAIAAGLKEGRIKDWRREHESENPALVVSKAEFKNTFLVSLGKSDAGITRVGEQVQIDSTSLEVHVLDGQGGTMRCWATAVIDVKSRYASVTLSRAPSGEVTIAAVRKFQRAACVPETVLY